MRCRAGLVKRCSLHTVSPPQSHHGQLQQVESRASRRPDASHQVLLRLTLTADDLRQLMRSLRQSSAVIASEILNEGTAAASKGTPQDLSPEVRW